MDPETGAAFRRLAMHLAADLHGDEFFGDCELTGFSGEGRCIEEAVAIRWENGFADRVCSQHAETAERRGAPVVFPARQDGHQT